ncbi:murein L,D-transpeptidase [Falsiroseomonas bella]|uniref:Murein L,D-transpeptidase n=1 Tax=Falsiroseomonas bella TaxID=2184016 RepID=A0A317FG23_9PROT|nr:L,D-transpeptidase family protein [Falsiroseomonas bella]PWS37745.1 murein L,D-transpeptidase [Falsiroseomonas bella]
METARRPLFAAALGLVAGPLATRPASAALAADRAAAIRLVERLRALGEDGLDPAHYAIPDPAMAASDPAGWNTALQRSATLALQDLLTGRVRELRGRPDLLRDAAAVGVETWQAELAAAAEPAAVISRAALRPPEAAALKAALAHARALAARGWPEVPGQATIEPGMVDPVRVPALRARLAAEDPVLAAAPDGGAAYDRALEDAVRRWQAANGLEVDGRVGRISLGLLNQPPEARVDQLRVALDMRRAAAPTPAERRIEVNVPDYHLSVLEDGREILGMAVIVGSRARQTPMLRVRMTAVQFNPPWGVPERNAREDLLPRFRRDPQAMMERGFRLFQVVGGERVEVDPREVDWSAMNRNNFPYFVRQDAGDANALGRIKFIMPNGDDIFMHDTPDRHLFRRPDRAFSSGCVRLERPMEFLSVVLQGTPGWDVSRGERAIASRTTSVVTLRNSLPVLLRYRTVIVEGGRVRIRPDVYGLDAAYARALDAGARAQVARL